MKLIYILIFLTVSLLIFIPGIPLFFIKDIPNSNQPSLKGTQPIYEEYGITQEFISQKNNLSGIATSIKNPQLRNKKDLIFSLFNEDNILLREVRLNGSVITDGGFMKIKFEKIKDSQDKSYKFTFKAPDVKGEESLELFLTDDNPSWAKAYMVNQDVHNMDISFVTLHGFNNRVEFPLSVLQSWVSKLYKDTIFFVLYVLIIVGITAYLLKDRIKN